jgi:hypothetical protein
MRRQVLCRFLATSTPLRRIPSAQTPRYLSTTQPLRSNVEASANAEDSPEHIGERTETSWLQEQERQKILSLRAKYLPDIIRQIDKQVAQV